LNKKDILGKEIINNLGIRTVRGMIRSKFDE